MKLTSLRGGLGPLISTNVSVCDMPKASSTKGETLRAEQNQRTIPHNVAHLSLRSARNTMGIRGIPE